MFMARWLGMEKATYEHISGPETILEVYNMLQALLNECTVIDFQILLAKAMSFVLVL